VAGPVGAGSGAGAARHGVGAGAALLAAHPATCDALVSLLGCEGTWEAATPGPPGAALVGRHPDTALALEALLAR
jgi:hypothetical protein